MHKTLILAVIAGLLGGCPKEQKTQRPQQEDTHMVVSTAELPTELTGGVNITLELRRRVEMRSPSGAKTNLDKLVESILARLATKTGDCLPVNLPEVNQSYKLCLEDPAGLDSAKAADQLRQYTAGARDGIERDRKADKKPTPNADDLTLTDCMKGSTLTGTAKEYSRLLGLDGLEARTMQYLESRDSCGEVFDRFLEDSGDRAEAFPTTHHKYTVNTVASQWDDLKDALATALVELALYKGDLGSEFLCLPGSTCQGRDWVVREAIRYLSDRRVEVLDQGRPEELAAKLFKATRQAWQEQYQEWKAAPEDKKTKYGQRLCNAIQGYLDDGNDPLSPDTTGYSPDQIAALGCEDPKSKQAPETPANPDAVTPEKPADAQPSATP
ncbi:MAG: hypothetical protein UY92_C0002G0048 [Candidatus Magasanikbacteria bacterium GW2011_GWA2_56_11]|uniref:Uncharacterized protein n=1 Tax=Candidatus Magasanikbacteria bacterium GW2011_GWA2_56_11 TaxID=1619044 RepID=A0A0G1YI57_9BACT|nr:MAG: hypothetical protein UY92_C0002G0048 [Candidatus Magasanikbacteria bacterium GW2011_GWA2_56_11]